MAPRRQNNTTSPQPVTQNVAPGWFELTIGKITTIGGAVLILFSVGGGAFQVGRTFKENEKNLEMFDLKLKHEKEKDSLKEAIKELANEIKLLKSGKSK